MASESRAVPFERMLAVPSGASRAATAAVPLGPVVFPPRGRMTVGGAIAILGGSILIALAVPLMVIALPVVLLARLVLSVVWARTR